MKTLRVSSGQPTQVAVLQQMPQPANRVMVQWYFLHPRGSVTVRVPDTGMPSGPLASPSCTYRLNTDPRSHMTRPLAALRYRAPLANICRRPPCTALCFTPAAPSVHIITHPP